MDYVQHLTAKGRQTVAVLHRFYMAFDAAASDSFVFVEGEEDQVFYGTIVEEYLGEFGNISWLICDGKPVVLAAFEDVKRENINCLRVLFFVDKDHDDFMQMVVRDRNIYVTHFYSIENYVVDVTCFSLFLRRYMNMDRSDPLFTEALTLFETMYGQFAALIRPFMAWTINKRRLGGKPNLNNVRMELCFALSVEHGGRVESVQGAKEIFIKDCGYEGADLECLGTSRVLDELMEREKKEFIRGKFEAWFFIKLINAISTAWRSRTKSNGKFVKLNIAVSSANFIQVMCGLFSYPTCLQAFLSDIGRQRAAESSVESA